MHWTEHVLPDAIDRPVAHANEAPAVTPTTPSLKSVERTVQGSGVHIIEGVTERLPDWHVYKLVPPLDVYPAMHLTAQVRLELSRLEQGLASAPVWNGKKVIVHAPGLGVAVGTRVGLADEGLSVVGPGVMQAADGNSIS